MTSIKPIGPILAIRKLNASKSISKLAKTYGDAFKFLRPLSTAFDMLPSDIIAEFIPSKYAVLANDLVYLTKDIDFDNPDAHREEIMELFKHFLTIQRFLTASFVYKYVNSVNETQNSSIMPATEDMYATKESMLERIGEVFDFIKGATLDPSFLKIPIAQPDIPTETSDHKDV